MKKIFLKELKMNLKTLLIWSLSVGGMGLACILLYRTMEGDMKEMADAFSNMGSFSDAFGMSTLSIATIGGFFATEVGAVHGLGGSMFAALMGAGMLSKEEELHTGEFLYSFPLSRKKIVSAKALCIVAMIAMFSVICAGMYACGFAMLGEELPARDFFTYMGLQLIMNLEIAGICFAISSIFAKTKTGLALGTSLMCYAYDIIGRVVPDVKPYLFIGPFSYSNASDIFSGAEIQTKAIIFGIALTILCVAFAYMYYDKRDLSS